MESPTSTLSNAETVDADARKVSLFTVPALEVGIANLKTASFPPSNDTVFFLVGSSDKSEDRWLIKVPLLRRQTERELRASTVLGKRAFNNFIVFGAPIKCVEPEFQHLIGFAMPFYPYSLHMLTEYLDGVSMEEREDIALKIAQRLSVAIRYAHRRGLLHCDIKPANILVDEHGERLADWGCCRYASDAHLRESLQSGYGTPRYQVVLESDWSMKMVDEVGLAMMILELIGLLQLEDVESPRQRLESVIEVVESVRLESLRASLLHLCRRRKTRASKTRSRERPDSQTREG